MTRYARGGIAITIASAPQEERSRSGSQPRFPYRDRAPFQGPPREAQWQDQDALAEYQQEAYHHQRNSSKYKRVPKELAGVESAIKEKVEYDRRMFQ